ncbi:MAG TPA: PRC-barrel domain-containing protein [Thermomicrobiales bacterium]|nr:PRC-barrel domain-containing protein [Thermomicrobiales bacterium]
MNAKSLIGMTVFAVDAGKNLGSVDRLLFSTERMRVTGLVIAPATGLMDEPRPQKLLPTDKVKAVGHDAITVDSESLLEVLADGELPAGAVAFDQIERERVLTESGEEIGEVSSVEFDELTFQLDYLEIRRGFLSGSSMIAVESVVSVGEDVIVVRDTALEDAAGRDRAEEDRVEHEDDDGMIIERR